MWKLLNHLYVIDAAFFEQAHQKGVARLAEAETISAAYDTRLQFAAEDERVTVSREKPRIGEVLGGKYLHSSVQGRSPLGAIEAREFSHHERF